MNFRLVFQSPPLRVWHWGRHCTIQLKHYSYCLPWDCVSLVTTGQLYPNSMPPRVCRKTLTPATVLPSTLLSSDALSYYCSVCPPC